MTATTDTPIATEALSWRLQHAFARLGVKTLGDLAARTADELRTAGGLGEISVDSVRRMLLRHNLELAGDRPPRSSAPPPATGRVGPMTTTTTDKVATLTCDCRPDGQPCATKATFAGSDRIDALTNARLAGWGIRDDKAARCPGCAAKKVMFPRPGGRKPGKASWC